MNNAEYFGTPKRVVRAAQDARKERKTPSGRRTKKAYFYNVGECVEGADQVTFKGVADVVNSAVGGDTEDPKVLLQSGRLARCSDLTFMRHPDPFVEEDEQIESTARASAYAPSQPKEAKKEKKEKKEKKKKEKKEKKKKGKKSEARSPKKEKTMKADGMQKE